jgi:DNA-binding NarL/FixJ family response regulator
MTTPSFLVVDDHPLFLEALQSTLEHGFPGAQVEVADTLSGARAMLGQKRFSLVLLDLRMPDAAGFEGLMQVRTEHPKTPLAVISAMTGTDIVAKVKDLGAEGFIYKSQPRQTILQSVQLMLDGGKCFPDCASASPTWESAASGDVIDRLRQLTPQQFKVLAKVCQAKLNKQIAYELGVTETTIKAHITLIFKKLAVHSRTQAVLLMQRLRSEIKDSEFSTLLPAEG